MKITKELKDVISRQLERKRREEADMLYAENKKKVAEFNKNILRSDEFKNLRSALEAWEKLICDIIEANPDVCIRHGDSYHSTDTYWNFAHLTNKRVVPLTAKACVNHSNYEELRDTIILKLSYEKDFEKAVEILSEYGITLNG